MFRRLRARDGEAPAYKDVFKAVLNRVIRLRRLNTRLRITAIVAFFLIPSERHT